MKILFSILLAATGSLVLASSASLTADDQTMSGYPFLFGHQQHSKQHPSEHHGQRKLQSCPTPPPPGPPPPIDLEILYISISIPALDEVLGTFETPMALRFTNYFGAMWWNCVAAFSADYKDTLTKTDPAVRVTDPLLQTTTNRGICMVQSIATYNSLALPDAQEGFFANIGGNNPFGLDVSAITGVVFDDTLDAGVQACGVDVACLNALASAQSYDPKLMGHIVAKLTYDYSLQDGFNELGTDDGCEVNCRPYRDVTGYAPVNDPWKVENQNKEARWEPLLEDNGRGFFYRQEHVTPHIGTTAKFRYVPESERTTRTAPHPSYTKKRLAEAANVIQLMSTLDDYKKIEIEVFDNKLIVGNTIINSFVGKILTTPGGFVEPIPDFQKPGVVLSLERFVHFTSAFLATELDAAIIAWKEKVVFDMVRPTSIIKRLGGDITTWAPGGIQTFRAADFEAYIRVMPHSEYVSGTACLFQAVEDFVVDYLSGIGLSTDFPVAFTPVDVGESVVEPGAVPSSCITLHYPSIEAMNIAGSQSRLNGGMHFDDSITGGFALCTGIGNHAATGSFDLYNNEGLIIVI